VTIDPDGDQGATPWATPTESQVIATSIPEIAIIGGEPYTATRGSVVANGHTFKLPALGGSNQVTATIDGVSMVLIPSLTGTVTVAVIPTARTTTSTATATATWSPGDTNERPPYGTQCQWLWECEYYYSCAPEDTMVCETTDYSHGAPLCQCIKGKIE
jgi:hypothetical protein